MKCLYLDPNPLYQFVFSGAYLFSPHLDGFLLVVFLLLLCWSSLLRLPFLSLSPCGETGIKSSY